VLNEKCNIRNVQEPLNKRNRGYLTLKILPIIWLSPRADGKLVSALIQPYITTAGTAGRKAPRLVPYFLGDDLILIKVA